MTEKDGKIKQKRKDTVKPEYLWWIPLVIIIFGFLLRYISVTLQETISVDSVRYLTFAQNYFQKILYTTGPTGLKEVPDVGYPILIAIGTKLTGGSFESVARWVSLISGTLTLILIYMLALRASGAKTAIYALFIAATCQPLIQYSSLIQTESLFILLLSIACYLSYAATRRGYNTFWFMAGGMCVGYLYLTRGIGISFLLIFPATVWLVSRYDGVFDSLKVQTRFVWGVVLFVVGFTIISFPYQIMLSRVYDSFVLSDQSKWHSPRVMHPERDFSPDPRYDGTLTSDKTEYAINTDDFFKSEPVSAGTWIKSFVTKYMKNQVGIYLYHLRELYAPLILVLLALGLFGAQWDRKFKTIMILFGIWSIPFLVLQPLYYTEARYIAPLAIFVFVIAGRGFVVLIEWFKNTFSKINPVKMEFALAIILFVFMFPMMIYPVTHRGNRYSYVDLRDAGFFLKGYIQNHEKGGVLSVIPIAGYYMSTELPNLVLPNENIETIIDFATRKEIKFIVLDERKIGFRPQLKKYLFVDDDSAHIPEELKLIYDNDDETGYKVRVFEITQETIDLNNLLPENRQNPPPFFPEGGE